MYDRPAPDATAIAMLDDSYGLAVIGYGVQRTVDGGAAWRETDAGAGVGGGQIAIVDRQRAWIAGYSGVILRTDDGGQTWQTRPRPRSAEFITFVDGAHGWASVWDSRMIVDGVACPCVMSTADGGRSWRASSTAPWQVGSLTFADARRGWATAWDTRLAPASRQPLLVATADGGRTWTPDLEMAGYSGGGVTLGGGRAWLQVGVSGNPWQYGRLILYRRDVAAPARLTAPDTGAGPRSGGGAPLAAMLGLAAGGVALGAAARAVRRHTLP